MAHRPTVNVILTYGRNMNARHDPCRNADFLQSTLYIKGIHNRRQHADLISHRAVHALGSFPGTAENIAAADHHADFDAAVVHVFNLPRQSVNDLGRHSETLVAHQALAGKFKQYALVFWIHQFLAI